MQTLALDAEGVLHGPYSGTFTSASQVMHCLLLKDAYELPDGTPIRNTDSLVFAPLNTEDAKIVMQKRRMAIDSPIIKANLKVGDFFFAYVVRDGRLFDTGMLVIATPDEPRPSLRLISGGPAKV
jgi:hypothetical protein